MTSHMKKRLNKKCGMVINFLLILKRFNLQSLVRFLLQLFVCFNASLFVLKLMTLTKIVFVLFCFIKVNWIL